ncbi:hypothetical protein C6P46_005896, partial [Rhodotorula mucilaginosa]
SHLRPAPTLGREPDPRPSRHPRQRPRPIRSTRPRFLRTEPRRVQVGHRSGVDATPGGVAGAVERGVREGLSTREGGGARRGGRGGAI